MFAPYYSYDTVHIINKNPHNTKLATDTKVLRNKSKKPFSTYIILLLNYIFQLGINIFNNSCHSTYLRI